MASTDSSEIVTHLRTVHFFLALACSLVLISFLASPSSDVKTAQEQLQKILSIRTNWNTWTQRFSLDQIVWLKNHNLTWPDTIFSKIHISAEESKRAGLAQVAAQWRKTFWTLVPLYSPIYFYVVVDRPDGFPSRHEILGHSSLKDYGPEIIPGGNAVVGPPLMDTLDGFRRFWNSAITVQAFIVTEFSKVIYVVGNGRVIIELPWDAEPKPEQGLELSLARKGFGRNGGKRCDEEIEKLFLSQWSPQFNTFFCTWLPTTRPQRGPEAFVLLANGRDQVLPINLRAWLAEEFHLSTVVRTFEEQFSALHRVTQDYQELELRKVERILGAELQRSGDRVEFLGLKFPERILSTWGAAIIVVIQLYFWLHLRAFHLRMTPTDPGLNLAWIGLYPDFIPRIISLTSASVLPSAVIFYLAFQNDWSPGILAFWVLGLLPTYGSFRLLLSLIRLINLSRLNPSNH